MIIEILQEFWNIPVRFSEFYYLVLQERVSLSKFRNKKDVHKTWDFLPNRYDF